MEQILMSLVEKYPSIVTVIMVIGGFRLLFKPIMIVVDRFVEVTPSKSDDAAIASFKNGKIYKGLLFAVDYLLSIKLPGQK